MRTTEEEHVKMSKSAFPYLGSAYRWIPVWQEIAEENRSNAGGRSLCEHSRVNTDSA